DRARQVTLHSLLSREHIAGHYGGRDFGLAADHLAQADRLMADRPDGPARVLVLGRLAVTQFGALRVADSIAAAESARALGARLGDEGAAEVSTAVAYGSSTALAGRVDRALEIFEQGIRRAEATGAVLGEEQIRMAGVMVAVCREDSRREWAAGCGYLWTAVMVALRLGELHMELGDGAAAGAELGWALEQCRARGAPFLAVAAHLGLAELTLVEERLGEAAVHVEKATAIL